MVIEEKIYNNVDKIYCTRTLPSDETYEKQLYMCKIFYSVINIEGNMNKRISKYYIGEIKLDVYNAPRSMIRSITGQAELSLTDIHQGIWFSFNNKGQCEVKELGSPREIRIKCKKEE